MAATRVLVASSDRVGAEMAGPAIRAYEIARALADSHEVTLVAPSGSSLPDDDPIEFAVASPGTAAFQTLTARHDVLVAQFLPGSVLARLIGLPIRLVVDLYDPRPLEVLERCADIGLSGLGLRARAEAADLLGYLAAADFVICASERQRDLWIGGLMTAGLIDPGRYSSDPGYRSFIDVVPFGIPDQGPRSSGRVLRGVWPGIGESDRVVIWGGGVWDWLDPIAAVQAVEHAAARVDGLKLFFLGTARPPEGEAGSFPAMTATSELEHYVADRGIEGTLVFLNRDWVPYRDRGAYLLEADLGLSTHRDHLEARYAFRTRILDYWWAGLPVVATEGDVLSELIASKSLGATAPAGQVEALGDAIAALLSDPGELEAAAARVRAFAPELAWSRAVEPLRRFCDSEPGARSTNAQRRARGLVRRARRLRRAQILGESGIRGVAREAGLKVRRLLGRV